MSLLKLKGSCSKSVREYVISCITAHVHHPPLSLNEETLIVPSWNIAQDMMECEAERLRIELPRVEGYDDVFTLSERASFKAWNGKELFSPGLKSGKLFLIMNCVRLMDE